MLSIGTVVWSVASVQKCIVRAAMFNHELALLTQQLTGIKQAPTFPSVGLTWPSQRRAP
jgi:hypothetical protein